jgi:hypothetical protein
VLRDQLRCDMPSQEVGRQPPRRLPRVGKAERPDARRATLRGELALVSQVDQVAVGPSRRTEGDRSHRIAA